MAAGITKQQIKQMLTVDKHLVNHQLRSMRVVCQLLHFLNAAFVLLTGDGEPLYFYDA